MTYRLRLTVSLITIALVASASLFVTAASAGATPAIRCTFSRAVRKLTGWDCSKVQVQHRQPSGMRVTSITITANPHVWSGHQAFRNVIVSLTGNRHHFTRTVFL